MGSDHVIEQKGKVQPKPSQEQAEPQKEDSHVTKADISGKLDASTITRMQQTLGNAAVQRFLAQRQGSGPSEISDETSQAIQSKKGGGQKLDSGIAQKAGGVMGHDFSDVNVHTDKESDTLNRQLGAKAFTTGNDIFFQSGNYDPGTSSGQELISHELTHVVQQGGAGAPVQGKMSVNDPNDAYEAEADNVANMVMNAPDESVAQRAAPEEEEAAPDAQSKADPSLQRDSEEEEGEQIAALKRDPAIQRAAPDEEVMPKPDPAIQRAAPDEEVMPKPDPSIQRAGEEEEVGLQGKLDANIQRAGEEEEVGLQGKLDANIQRAAEEDEMGLKPDPNLQRQEEEPYE